MQVCRYLQFLHACLVHVANLTILDIYPTEDILSMVQSGRVQLTTGLMRMTGRFTKLYG